MSESLLSVITVLFGVITVIGFAVVRLIDSGRRSQYWRPAPPGQYRCRRRGCGQRNPGGVRFCRRCGEPAVGSPLFDKPGPQLARPLFADDKETLR